MTEITKETVAKVARLAKLEVSDQEAQNFSKQLGHILTMIEKLNDLDTTNVEPTSHAIDIPCALRSDVAEPGLNRADVLKNAPETQDGMFKVPTILTD